MLGLTRYQINGARDPDRYAVTREALRTKILPYAPPEPIDIPPIVPLRIPYTYPYSAEEKLQMQQQTVQIQVCPPSCPEGYSAPGVLLPGWIQPQCIRAPCPAMYVGDKETWITEIFERPDGVIVATDDDGDVVATAERKPNLVPLALAAAAAAFFLM